MGREECWSFWVITNRKLWGGGRGEEHTQHQIPVWKILSLTGSCFWLPFSYMHCWRKAGTFSIWDSFMLTCKNKSNEAHWTPPVCHLKSESAFINSTTTKCSAVSYISSYFVCMTENVLITILCTDLLINRSGLTTVSKAYSSSCNG